MNVLVGYTGFVGSNLYENGQFDAVYNSKNIGEAFGTNPDLLIYAGLRAEKYLANQAPEKDMERILQAEENIRKIDPKKLVLISTIDVLKNPKNMDENARVETENLHPYGYNRYQLEEWVREHYPEALIVRLPGLFGKNIKKNFIYDFINRIPYMLRTEKVEELSKIEPELLNYYELQDNGFYKVKTLDMRQRVLLKEKFQKLGFSALNFTDSRSRYQFYPLNRLWDDIQIALENEIRLWHPATEPISAAQLYQYLTGNIFENKLSGVPADYNYKTVYYKLYDGADGYICNRETIMNEIKKFVEGYYLSTGQDKELCKEDKK